MRNNGNNHRKLVLRTTIRGIDPDVLAEARQIVRENPGLTMGEFVSEALGDYIESLPFEDELESHG